MSDSKVLFVDDEENILTSCQRLLRKESFEVLTCSNPEEALKLFDQHTFAVVVSDHRMPQMEGTVFLAKVRELAPATIRLILTGYADMKSAVDAINKGAVARFLTKPWNDDDLRMNVRQAVNQYELISENRRLQELTVQQNKELESLNQNLEQKVAERTAEVVQLNQSLEKSLLGTVQVLAEATEIHSPVIGNHARRVTILAEAMGRQLGLSDRQLFDLKIAASLHEIGILGISQEVLDKPESQRSVSEIAQFRRHMLNGERIIKGVPYLENVARTIRHYKESFDGSGLPDQLVDQPSPLNRAFWLSPIDTIWRSMHTPLSKHPHRKRLSQKFANSVPPGLTPKWSALWVTVLVKARTRPAMTPNLKSDSRIFALA